MPKNSLSGLKIALAHDWLTSMGGAEQVLLVLHKMFPEAPIFTTVFDAQKIPELAKADVRTSGLQKWPWARRHQLWPHVRPQAVEKLDLSGFDIVISSTTAEMKGLIVKPETLHISYLHTSTRYYWDQYHDYFDRMEFGILNPLVRLLMPYFTYYLRQWDYLAAQRPDFLIANSYNSARRIAKYYHREAEVIPPPVKTARFQKGSSRVKKGDYFVYFGRLIPQKRVDLAVSACRILDLPLKISGVGPELSRLKKMAGSRAEFLGRVSDEELPGLIAGARGFITAALDDFGIVPLEAAAAGTATIAYGAGGALETVVPGKTGEFFSEQTVDSLVGVLQKFDSGKYFTTEMQKWTAQFSEEIFQERILEFVEKKWGEWSVNFR